MTEGTAIHDAIGVPRERPATAAAARDQVRRVLGTLPGGVPQHLVDDILLVTSELVTNALRHGGGVAAFHVVLEPGTLRVAVTDRSPALPVDRAHGSFAGLGGFGWPLIQRLSDTVTVTSAPRGKTIEVLLACAPRRG
ncbi:ATP-binding protein [Streptomyces sp. NPDC048182]|uniref:ATP-binding protein n=1 Tax=unclassified Streptomyces TaxID=2593676 RepID=UPI0033BE2C4B